MRYLWKVSMEVLVEVKVVVEVEVEIGVEEWRNGSGGGVMVEIENGEVWRWW